MNGHLLLGGILTGFNFAVILIGMVLTHRSLPKLKTPAVLIFSAIGLISGLILISISGGAIR